MDAFAGKLRSVGTAPSVGVTAPIAAIGLSRRSTVSVWVLLLCGGWSLIFLAAVGAGLERVRQRTDPQRHRLQLGIATRQERKPQ